MTQRLPIETFDLPVTELRAGYRSAVYFARAKTIMEKVDPKKVVTMQVFQKHHSVACGIDEAIAILKVATGHWKDNDKAWQFFQEYLRYSRHARAAHASTNDWDLLQLSTEGAIHIEQQLNEMWVPEFDKLTVKALNDGDEIEPWEPVMTIEGPYASFAHLESVYLGVLARRTLVATNVRRVCEAAGDKPLLFFADRFDHYATQGGDGYSARIGGASGVATDAMAAWWGEKGMGTIPHSLIAAFDGDVVKATMAFADEYPTTNVVALVDFHNDCVNASLACAKNLGDRLWGVRLDTSENMVDRSVAEAMMRRPRTLNNTAPEVAGDTHPNGVNPLLVRQVRQALDQHDFQHVKIIVSGGFNVGKIRGFEADNVPVDVYAVGSSLLRGENDFTADVTRPVAKMGRWKRDDSRLSIVT